MRGQTDGDHPASADPVAEHRRPGAMTMKPGDRHQRRWRSRSRPAETQDRRGVERQDRVPDAVAVDHVRDDAAVRDGEGDRPARPWRTRWSSVSATVPVSRLRRSIRPSSGIRIDAGSDRSTAVTANVARQPTDRADDAAEERVERDADVVRHRVEAHDLAPVRRRRRALSAARITVARIADRRCRCRSRATMRVSTVGADPIERRADRSERSRRALRSRGAMWSSEEARREVDEQPGQPEGADDDPGGRDADPEVVADLRQQRGHDVRRRDRRRTSTTPSRTASAASRRRTASARPFGLGSRRDRSRRRIGSRDRAGHPGPLGSCGSGPEAGRRLEHRRTRADAIELRSDVVKGQSRGSRTRSRRRRRPRPRACGSGGRRGPPPRTRRRGSRVRPASHGRRGPRQAP